jgi:hypothetical protein
MLILEHMAYWKIIIMELLKQENFIKKNYDWCASEMFGVLRVDGMGPFVMIPKNGINTGTLEKN